MIRLKNEKDIAGIRKAGKVLAETFSILKDRINEGTTTETIDRIAHDFIVSRGGAPTFLGYMDYPASVCASVNQVVIHGIPDKRELEQGDILSLDLGVTLDGYIADSARTFCIGEVNKEAQKQFNGDYDIQFKPFLDHKISNAKTGNKETC